MDMKPLRTEQDYDLALAEIAKHFQHEPEPDTAAASRYHALATLIAAYEAKRWPIMSVSSETEAAPCRLPSSNEEGTFAHSASGGGEPGCKR